MTMSQRKARTKLPENQETRVFTSFFVFLPIRTIFELNRHIQKTHVLTEFHEDWTKKCDFLKNCLAPWRPSNVLNKFHDDWAKMVTSRVFTRFLYSHIKNIAPPPGVHVFQRTETIFEPTQHII
ncbi:hypothetical protein DPMN_159338 [Dreissena polymorpha]|uniref:Uncharacterized protein n=1 Tax=Dreissena polymorpha TaxID=45954 RepID=A0A9D4EKV4_DREPO|nr:hypothetical protein DPMN_159338 [Dreissena polymorpha]